MDIRHFLRILKMSYIHQIIKHEVFITGYNDVTSTNSQVTVQYFDPETGKYATATPDKFLNALKVTGLK